MKKPEPIAIIGIGCRFPGGADSPEAFWRLLRDGVDAIREVPAERFDVGELYDPVPSTPGRIMTRWGGFLDRIEEFDADFFHISPREAVSLDPQQRLLLETTWEALESAGAPVPAWRGRSVGVFMGMWLNEYEARMFRRNEDIEFYMTTGTGRYSASGRLSNQFGWNGPSLTIDCACSSSLVAIHLACQSLRLGESEMAIAGGANVILEPSITIAYSQSRMMAPDGHCKFGDARADGYVRSDGAGVVVLKRLTDAVAAGDPIVAVIRGSAVNNDGDTSGSFGTPGRAGQEDLLRKAYRDASVDPSTVWYAEAHGTGTRAGDPVEIGALAAVLGAGRAKDRPLVVGSVKTNIGHTEGAAGVAGVIKAALAVQNGVIPRSLHFVEPNPEIPWDELGVRVPREEVLEDHAGRVAGVSSFGIAGTNAHVVIEQYPDRSGTLSRGSRIVERPVVLALSAASEPALREVVGRTSEALRRGVACLRDVAYTASRRRAHLEHRLAVVGCDASSIVNALDGFARGEARREVATGRAEPGRNRRVAFVFPGQGGQWIGMARRLRADEPTFREALGACDAAIREYGGFSVLDEIAADESVSRFDEMDIVQPVLFAVQVALARLWEDLGVTASAVVGHSMGEVAAAHVAGILSLGDAVRVIVDRSRLLKSVSGRGAMAVVELTFDEAAREAQSDGGRLSVAVSNSERSTVLSGDPAAIDALTARLEAKGVFCRRVNVTVAAHSSQMDPLRPELVASLQGLAAQPERLIFASTVTGGPLSGPQAGAEYWGRNLREPVRFAQAVKALRETGFDTFIEIGPHPVLLHALRQESAEGVIAVASTRREEDEQAVILESFGTLFASGANVDWERVNPEGSHVALPGYPWQRERFWIEGTAATAPAMAAAKTSFTVKWRHEALPGTTTVSPASVVLFSDASGFADNLQGALHRLGASTILVPRSDPALASEGAARDRLARILEVRPITHVVHASSLDPAADWDETYSLGPLSALHLVQALTAGNFESQPRLWLVGEIPSAHGLNAGSAMLDGLGRIAASEHPRLRTAAAFLGADRHPSDVERLADSIVGNDPDNQLRFTDGSRQVGRLESGTVSPGERLSIPGSEGTYLIAGGLGGLGLLTARHLVEKEGVRHLALVGRRPPGEQARSEIASLTAAGATVRTFEADVSHRQALADVLAAIASDGPALSGIIHAAGVLDDVTLVSMTDARFRSVAASKVEGAWNLHELTADRALEAFVLYSSVVPLLGLAGQGNYAAANTFLDALAAHRTARGLAATSVAWGPWSSVGLAADGEQRGGRLAASGLPSLHPKAALAHLEVLLRAAPEYAAVFDVDWERFAAAFPNTASWPSFSGFVRARDAANPAGDLKARAEAIEIGPLRLAFLEDCVSDVVGAVVRRPASQVDRDKPFRSLGVDSLMGLEVRNRLERAFAVSIPATLIWNFPTVHGLVPELARRSEITLAAQAASTSSSPEDAELERVLREVERMSDEEARERAAGTSRE